MDRLGTETGDPDVRRLFDVASALQVNFYKNWRASEAVVAWGVAPVTACPSAPAVTPCHPLPDVDHTAAR